MEMQYCYEQGIPHSRFLSWPDEDQDKVIAYMIWKGGRCGHCGTHPDEWLDEEGRAAEPAPYHTTTRKCYGCASLDDAREQIPKDQRSSVHVFLARPVRSERQSRSSP